MSGGSDSTTSGPPDWAVPYFQNFLNKGAAVSELPYQPYTGQRNADMNAYQVGGLNAQANRALQGSPVNAAAGQNLTDTLSGKYLSDGNPYLTSQIDQAQGDVLRGYNNTVIPRLDALNARSGSFGNAGLQQYEQNTQNDLVNSLGKISTDMRYQNYGDERNRQMQGISQAPSIANQDYVDAGALAAAGDPFQKYQLALLDTQYGNFTEAWDYPKQQLATLGTTLGAGYGNTTTGPAPNKTAGTLGGAAAGASLGSSFGPYGALIGGGLGAVGGGK